MRHFISVLKQKVSSEDNEKSWVTYQDTQLAKEKNYKALGQPGRMQL